MRKEAQAEKLSSNMVLHINQQGWGASELECQFSGKKAKYTEGLKGKLKRAKQNKNGIKCDNPSKRKMTEFNQ